MKGTRWAWWHALKVVGSCSSAASIAGASSALTAWRTLRMEPSSICADEARAGRRSSPLATAVSIFPG